MNNPAADVTIWDHFTIEQLNAAHASRLKDFDFLAREGLLEDAVLAKKDASAIRTVIVDRLNK